MKGKLNILTVITTMIFFFGMTASHADISVSGYDGSYKPRPGDYEGKIKSVQIGSSNVTDPSGKIIRKHNYVYLDTTGAGNLRFTFDQDDLQNGLALMGAIGKNIGVSLDLDEKNAFIVKNITIK